MLATRPLSSATLASRGEPSAWNQRCVSSRRPSRISFHPAASTADTFHASSHLASANGLPPSVAKRFMSEKPYRTCCACAAMVAPSFTEREASDAESVSSDRRKPASPELRTSALPSLSTPYASSENNRASTGAISLVFMIAMEVRIDYNLRLLELRCHPSHPLD